MKPDLSVKHSELPDFLSLVCHLAGSSEPETVAVDSNGISGLVFADGNLYFGGEYTPSIKYYNPITTQIFSLSSTHARSWPLGYSSLGPRDRNLKRGMHIVQTTARFFSSSLD